MFSSQRRSIVVAMFVGIFAFGFIMAGNASAAPKADKNRGKSEQAHQKNDERKNPESRSDVDQRSQEQSRPGKARPSGLVSMSKESKKSAPTMIEAASFATSFEQPAVPAPVTTSPTPAQVPVQVPASELTQASPVPIAAVDTTLAKTGKDVSTPILIGILLTFLGITSVLAFHDRRIRALTLFGMHGAHLAPMGTDVDQPAVTREFPFKASLSLASDRIATQLRSAATQLRSSVLQFKGK